MKKALALLLAAAMSLSLASCGGGGTTPSTSNGDGSKSEIELNTGGVATAMENAAESVTVAVDDDSFTIGPWGSDSAVRDWTETIMWTHLAYRPFIGAAFDAGELELVAAKSVNKVDGTTYEVEIYDLIN